MKLAEYCQQLEHLKMSLNEIYQELDQRPIKRYVAIVHDKDTLANGEPKPPHLHVMMELQSNQDISNIAKWFEDETQYINKATTKGKFAFHNMVSYALHLTDTSISDGKYKYEISECKSNFDLSKLVELISNDVVEAKLKKAQLEKIYNDIMENKIPHSQLGKYFSNQEWLEHNKDIETCYKIRNIKILEKMEEQKDMNVIYCTGKAGTGKTTYAKQIAKMLGYHFFVTSSGADPLGEYDGQECIILDDLRKENFTYSELLKFLDNNTHSYVKSRYSNKCPYNCKLLIITSVLDPQELYSEYELTSRDSFDQLMRRINSLVVFDDDKEKLDIYEYDEASKEFVYHSQSQNPLKSIMALQEKYPKVADTLIGLTEKMIAAAVKSKVKKLEENTGLEIRYEDDETETETDNVPRAA